LVVFEGISEQPIREVHTEPLPFLCPSRFFLERERTEGAAGSSLGGTDGSTSKVEVVA
jgi:hypothetical protein